jgi:hypothetical protein
MIYIISTYTFALTCFVVENIHAQHGFYQYWVILLRTFDYSLLIFDGSKFWN